MTEVQQWDNAGMQDAFRSLDLNLLRVFAVLMAEGSVTRTAARLSLSQSAVSNALARLRLALDNALFEKVPSGMRPTDRARELWFVLGPHYEALQEAISPKTFDASQFKGALTIAMSDYTVERVMPRLIAHLSAHAPGLRLELEPFSVAHLQTLFERGGIDLAIGAYINDTASGLRNHLLWHIHSSVLMRRDHPLAKGRLTLSRFLAARHVDIRLSGTVVPLYDSLLASHGRQRNLVLTLNHYTQALAVIAESDCIGVLPVSLLDLNPHASKLIAREPPIAMPVRPFGVIWHQRRNGDQAHQWLRQTIIDLFARAEPGDR